MSSVARLALRGASVLVLGLVALYLTYGSDTGKPVVSGGDAPALQLSSDSLDFGVVGIDEASSAVLTLTNAGGADSGPLVIDLSLIHI